MISNPPEPHPRRRLNNALHPAVAELLPVPLCAAFLRDELAGLKKDR
jgi:hypothetical protein